MNAEDICNAAVAGSLTEEQAIAELVKLGFNEEDARDQVFIAMGGDDVISGED